MAGEGFNPCPRNGMSYVVGDTEVPLAHVTVPALLEATGNRYPDAEAVVFREQGVRWTWRTFAEQVDALAAGLHALGLERGDRIGIWSPNRFEWTLTQFATAKAGLILVNINPAYRLSEVEYALNKVGCKALIVATAFKTSDYIGMVNPLAPELARARPGHLDAAKLPHLKTVIQIGGADAGTSDAQAKAPRDGIRGQSSEQVRHDAEHQRQAGEQTQPHRVEAVLFPEIVRQPGDAEIEDKAVGKVHE